MDAIIGPLIAMMHSLNLIIKNVFCVFSLFPLLLLSFLIRSRSMARETKKKGKIKLNCEEWNQRMLTQKHKYRIIKFIQYGIQWNTQRINLLAIIYYHKPTMRCTNLRRKKKRKRRKANALIDRMSDKIGNTFWLWFIISIRIYANRPNRNV